MANPQHTQNPWSTVQKRTHSGAGSAVDRMAKRMLPAPLNAPGTPVRPSIPNPCFHMICTKADSTQIDYQFDTETFLRRCAARA